MKEQASQEQAEAPLKLKTARTLKWNTIDRLASQVLYGVVGVVLANVVSQEEFGLVGALIVFQSFAIIFADSGFGAALLQRKDPTDEDYSTVFWFNLVVSVSIYWTLWLCAPLIADIFQGDRRLIPLSKVMFLTFVFNALAIVQTNRLMKRMDVKMIAVSNVIAQVAGGALGIGLALAGYGAWALVWQSVALAGIKTGILWATGRWLPTCWIKKSSLAKVWRIGLSVFCSSMLNTVFLSIYSFVIGAFYSLRALGVYTQADKWSKMGISSLSQVLTSSFLPALSAVQDDPERFARVTSKMNRFTSYLLFPAMGFLAVMATPVFHCLFGEKWDASIVLFQLLLARGIFTVLTSLYNNYVIALARTRLVVAMEVLRDGAALLLLFAALPFISMERGGDVVYGIKLLLAGQILASAISWGVMVVKTAPVSGRSVGSFLADSLPYLCETLLIMAVLWGESLLISDCWKLLVCQGVTCIALYVGINALLNSVIQREVFAFLRGKKLE